MVTVWSRVCLVRPGTTNYVPENVDRYGKQSHSFFPTIRMNMIACCKGVHLEIHTLNLKSYSPGLFGTASHNKHTCFLLLTFSV